MKLHYYTLKHLTIAILAIIALWAALFYAFILDEVYDNIDDGLRNTKIQIIKAAYKNPSILENNKFKYNNFRITLMPEGNYSSKSILSNMYEYSEYDDEDEPIRVLTTYFYSKKGVPYKLEIKASMIEQDDLLTDLSTALIVLYIMLVISIFIVDYFLLKKVWNPFYKLLDKIKKYNLGSIEDLKMPIQRIKEFEDLETGIEKMIQRNENTFTQQKNFLSHAAHELQTPLAISINKLELLAEDSKITEKQMEIISSVNDNLDRLVKLNKSLLMLSRIENNQFTKKDSITFNEFIKISIDDFSDLTQHKNIAITIEEKGVFHYEMDKGLAMTLINNLLKNAIVHNYPQGKIHFIISDSYFLIQNSSNLPALDKNLIFNHFYRHTTHSQSTGLGLALVKTIINVNKNISIDYFFDGMQNFKVSKI